MPHRHRWPYVVLLPLWLFLPFLLALPSPTPPARTRHHEQRQLHRLAGGHLRILDSDPDDSELITASAGENVKGKKGGNADERKTLSQQVADGKYGLIQKELFKKQPKRPGIISYAPNSEVPKDNIATLGGLTKNDIWLAENHLLVIKGGAYPPHDDSKQDYISQIWQPIDDYSAPLHQVKIPKNPAVPPPFPVQLSDDGPLQILGTNSSRTLNASAETPAYALPPPPGWDGEIPPQGEYFPETGPANSDQTDPASGQVTLRVPVSGEPAGGMPFPPTLLNGSFPPSFAHLPPGAAILPAPLGNDTILDEDDPSIYYPPPYSFYYPKDNTSLVPPGPLVPGIILPPPPKFFAPLEEPPKPSTRRPPQTRPTFTTTTNEPPLNNEISTSRPITTVPTRVSVIKNYSKVTVRVSMPRKPHSRHPTKPSQTTSTTGKPKVISILPVHVDRLNRTYLPARKPSVTILKPIKPETVTSKAYAEPNEVAPPHQFEPSRNPNKHFNRNPYNYKNIANQRPTFDRQREWEQTKFTDEVISTTQVPLRYQATANDLELNAVTPGAEQFSIGKNPQFSKTTRKPQSNFYYYEETDPALNAITTEAPQAKPNPAYDSWNQFYSTPRRPSKAPSVKPQYIYLTGRPYEREKPKFRYIPQSQPRPKPQTTFSIHIANLQNQLSQQYFTTPDSLYRPTSKPVYQYSFEAQNYNRPGGKAFKPSQLMDSNEDGFKPIPKYSVQIQPAIEIVQTQRPNYQQIQPLNVEEPGYYSNEPQASKPQSQYLQEVQRPSGYGQSGLRYLPPQQRPTIAPDAVQVTPSRPIAEYSYESTPNPVYQGFYTKPDEGYFDENTKQYFTIFGRKLASTTTPLPLVTRPTSPRPARYRQGNYNPPISLHSDLNVNYAQPRPPINPLSEPIDNRPQVDSGSNPEIIKAIEITPPPIASRGKKEQYIHYQLPGDEGAHFYFLTPQAAERRRQAGQYFYERDARVRRDKPQQEEKSKN
uniref:DUF4794 domain-containing protein n=1 Tax=Dendroctonus ponderosae TaxID=77166 RepID=A0AAR5QJ98_DENPD